MFWYNCIKTSSRHGIWGIFRFIFRYWIKDTGCTECQLAYLLKIRIYYHSSITFLSSSCLALIWLPLQRCMFRLIELRESEQVPQALLYLLSKPYRQILTGEGDPWDCIGSFHSPFNRTDWMRKTLVISLSISHVSHFGVYSAVHGLREALFQMAYLTLWGQRCFFGVLEMFWHALTFVLFSIAYKHINGTGEITLFLSQTGLP